MNLIIKYKNDNNFNYIDFIIYAIYKFIKINIIYI
jgi:hypothetical protein